VTLSLLPWDVREEHRDAHLHLMLERESLRREGLPFGTAEEAEALEAWKASLRRHSSVVDYRAETRSGFFLVYAAEGEDLIRRPSAR